MSHRVWECPCKSREGIREARAGGGDKDRNSLTSLVLVSVLGRRGAWHPSVLAGVGSVCVLISVVRMLTLWSMKLVIRK